MARGFPVHVTPIKDRHGKERYRYRRKGISEYLPGAPGSDEFMTRYHELEKEDPATYVKSAQKVRKGSFDDLFKRYRQAPRWKRKKAKTQYTQGRILTRFSDREDRKGRYGNKLAASFTVDRLDTILGRMSDTPAAANNLRDLLIELYDYAIRLQWVETNPARLTAAFKKGKGHHTWTDEQIEQYRATHDYGTTARLVMELALNTAARRENLTELQRDDIRKGKIAVAHVKGGDETLVQILPETQKAMDAMATTPFKYLIQTAYGKKFSPDGLGNRMQAWTKKAGLKNCSLHGLRKALSRQVAESGSTDAQGRAITGQKKNETFAYYAEKANREQLADEAVSNLVAARCPTPKESQ